MNRASKPLPTPLCPTRSSGRGSGARRSASSTALSIAAEQAMIAPAASAGLSIAQRPETRVAGISESVPRPRTSVVRVSYRCPRGCQAEVSGRVPGGSLRPHLRQRRCSRWVVRVDRERHLREIRFASLYRIPLAQNLGAIVAPAIALDHFVDREFLSVHPLEVHPAPRPPVVLAPYCYDPSERPQVRDHNLRDIPGLSGNLSYESSDVW